MDTKRLGRRKEKRSHSVARLDAGLAWLLRSRTSGMEGLVLHPILLWQLLPSHLICLALHGASSLPIVG